MTSSLNKVILIGNLGKDPDLHYTNDGKKFVTFSLATSESWKDKVTSERKSITEWHKIVIYNDHLSDFSSKYLHKGDKIYLEGQVRTRKWTDDQGNEKYITEVVLPQFKGQIVSLSSKQDNESQNCVVNSISSDVTENLDQAGIVLPYKTSPYPSYPIPLNDEVPF